MIDHRKYEIQDLVLNVSKNIDPSKYDYTLYEKFIEELCSDREYQKEAIRIAMRYIAGDQYASVQDLAEENYVSNQILERKYGKSAAFISEFQLPNQVSASIDLPTAAGKSYVMYAIARIALAHGLVDRVLILCPSLTIEKHLLEKFRLLSGNASLSSLLPTNSQILNPHIISATESITEGTICIENFHAVLRGVGSSIRDSLKDKGPRTLVLNDEVHHVYNSSEKDMGKWKEFLVDEEFNFKYILGFSGTCYIGNDYFSDVIFRLPLQDLIEQGFAKGVDYVAEDVSESQYEKFQKIYSNHQLNREKYSNLKPLSIFVTKDITSCERLAEDFVKFLAEHEGKSREDVSDKILVVTSSPKHASNVVLLDSVDSRTNPIEWIFSVSMLTEGWDVKNVFQIVPHEERAFNSKLLISQVLGRGLRVPNEYKGERPIVKVFNHDSWSGRIEHLVSSILESEVKLFSFTLDKQPDYNFTIHQFIYEKTTILGEIEEATEFDFNKEFVLLESQSEYLDRETYYGRIGDKEDVRRSTLTKIRYRMYSVEEVANHILKKLQSIDLEIHTDYSSKYNKDWLEKMIRASLRNAGEDSDFVSEANRQHLQAAFGSISSGSNATLRYTNTEKELRVIKTESRPRDSISLSLLRRGISTIFIDHDSVKNSDPVTQAVIKEMESDDSLPRSAYYKIENRYLFKTPLNLAIASSRPEKDFLSKLTQQASATSITSWIKSTDNNFYSIEYSLRQGKSIINRSFNPDFFIKIGNIIFVIEIKSDEDSKDPSQENKAKFHAAKKHFSLINSKQQEIVYHFHFLTPTDYDKFFKFIIDKNYNYISKMDVALESSEND
ncbi:DEAD/DEAH box helicase family protein [Deinococcus humi]|uniref:Type III restriction enzyme n=1 Tax=Deinococcus humi TaxID=662880 RepID=A0A7W8NJ04_9DEIO|nr:DEAD/DEAH box helicase family protein [Deinococcus humi]MBB5365612.1 type III restriction enzyme [Deinococcus humi]GGO36791.1 type III restriction endonuclease subunit R [Deinococcus humi]